MALRSAVTFSGDGRDSGDARSARCIQTTWATVRVCSRAAHPAMIPSKSSGNRCASMSACLPPEEHPTK